MALLAGHARSVVDASPSRRKRDKLTLQLDHSVGPNIIGHPLSCYWLPSQHQHICDGSLAIASDKSKTLVRFVFTVTTRRQSK